MTERRAFAYPPFIRLVVLYMKHRDKYTVESLAAAAAHRLQLMFANRVLGPEEPPVSRISSLYIRRIIVKLESGIPLHRAKELLSQLRNDLLSEVGFGSAQLYYDVDPL